MVCIICYESVLGDKNPHATVFFTAAASHKTCRPAALKCGHTFHKKCVETWFKTSKNTKCPVCNARHSGPVITLFIELDTTETSTSVKNATSIERNTCGTCMKDKEVDKEKQINNVVSEHETLSTEDNNIWRNLYITDLVHVSAAHNEKVSLLNKEICELKEKMAQMLEIHKGEMNRMKQSRATLETQVAQRKSMIYVIANKLKAEMAKNAEFVDMFNQLMDDSRRQQAYIKSLQEALLKARTRTDDKQLYLSWTMVCIICFESLFKSQGTEGAVYANTRHSDEDLAERPAALTCGHVFHKECIEEWFHRPEGPKCPLCQKLPMDIPRILFVDLDEDDVERFLSEEQLARKRKMESELGRRVQKIFDIIAESKEFDDEEIFELTMQVTGLSDQIESAERKLAERQEECATIGTKIEHLEGVVASSDKRLESLTAAAKAKRRQREYRELKILFS